MPANSLLLNRLDDNVELNALTQRATSSTHMIRIFLEVLAGILGFEQIVKAVLFWRTLHREIRELGNYVRPLRPETEIVASLAPYASHTVVLLKDGQIALGMALQVSCCRYHAR